MNLPTAIVRDPQGGIEITWDDQLSTRWSVRELRQACPCATCREKHGRRSGGSPSTASQTPPATQPAVAAPPRKLPVITAAEAQPLQILGMKPVGNYAYQIQFSDGHSSGIFSLALLREKR